MPDDRAPGLAEELCQKLVELEANIRRDQATAKKIRELLGLLVRGGHVSPVTVEATRGTVHTSLAAVLAQEASPTKKESIREAIRKELGKHPSMHRTGILQHLKAIGLMGTEKDPMRALAIYLSEFDEVESLGHGKWRLRPPGVGAG